MFVEITDFNSITDGSIIEVAVENESVHVRLWNIAIVHVDVTTVSQRCDYKISIEFCNNYIVLNIIAIVTFM